MWRISIGLFVILTNLFFLIPYNVKAVGVPTVTVYHNVSSSGRTFNYSNQGFSFDFDASKGSGYVKNTTTSTKSYTYIIDCRPDLSPSGSTCWADSDNPQATVSVAPGEITEVHVGLLCVVYTINFHYGSGGTYGYRVNLASGCTSPTNTPVPQPTATPRPTFTPTPRPTATPTSPPNATATPTPNSPPTVTPTPRPTATETPVPLPTDIPTPTVTPIVDPTGTATCGCQTDNTCSFLCTFDMYSDITYGKSDPTLGQLQMCYAPPILFASTPSQNEQDGRCTPASVGGMNERTKGDADHNGVIDYLDYYYYMRSVNGGFVATWVDPDFNLDGDIGLKDRDIVVRTLIANPPN